jgi:uncharacterized protein
MNEQQVKPEMILISEVYLQSDQGNQRMIVLKEHKDADLFFMMFVGESEFMALAKEKGLFNSPRPMTHETYLKILEDSSITFIKVEIVSMVEGTFYANIHYRKNGEEITLDARPSDSVALALHLKIPLYVNKDIMRRVFTESEIEEFKDIIKTVKF